MASPRSLLVSLPESAPLSPQERGIIRQVEHYFGDYNLPKDKFMAEVMEQDGGWVPMTVMLTFRRLARLSDDPQVLFSALEKSRSGLLQLDRANGRLRRDPNLPLPEQSDERALALQERTVYVSGFDRASTTLDDLIPFFEGGFEKVVNVRMRYRRASAAHQRDYRREAVAARGRVDENNNIIEGPEMKDGQRSYDPGQFLGSVFVVFGTRQAAESFLSQTVTYRSRPLYAKLQRDYLVKKPEHNDKFDRDALPRTVWVHGFDDGRITEAQLADFFGSYKGAASVRKRVYRDRRDEPWTFTGAVFVTFDTTQDAEAFLDQKEFSYRGDRLKVKLQADFYKDKGFFSREFEKMDQEKKTRA